MSPDLECLLEGCWLVLDVASLDVSLLALLHLLAFVPAAGLYVEVTVYTTVETVIASLKHKDCVRLELSACWLAMPSLLHT